MSETAQPRGRRFTTVRRTAPFGAGLLVSEEGERRGTAIATVGSSASVGLLSLRELDPSRAWSDMERARRVSFDRGVLLDEPLLTAADVARLLAVPRSSVYEYAAPGEQPASLDPRWPAPPVL